MGRCDELVERWMAVSAHDFSWVDEYMDCGFATADYTPLSMFQYGMELGSFTRRGNNYN